jgi:hypothetical protein
MKYELTITMSLESKESRDRVAKQFTSLFEFGTIRDSIADALKLGNDPRLLAISVERKTRPPAAG